MKIKEDETFHIYNQGNNKQTIFFQHSDYLEFLQLFRKFVSPTCKVLAYCLMPNHFHFLIYVTPEAAKPVRIGNIESTKLSNGFRLMESIYAQYLNKRINRSGSLFRQRTKAKSLRDGDAYYGYLAFHYIHQNPLQSGLVTKLEDWEYSSFAEYAQLTNDTMCDKELAFLLLDLDQERFNLDAYTQTNAKKLACIFS